MKIASKTTAEIKLPLMISLGPPWAPQSTCFPISGNITASVAVAITAQLFEIEYIQFHL